MVTDGLQQAVVCTVLAALFVCLSVFFLIGFHKEHSGTRKEKTYLWIVLVFSSTLIYWIWDFYSRGWF